MTWELKVRRALARALGSMIDAAIPIVSSILLLELDFLTAVKVILGAGIVCLLRSLAHVLQGEEKND